MIGSSAFTGCDRLTSATIPGRITDIGGGYDLIAREGNMLLAFRKEEPGAGARDTEPLPASGFTYPAGNPDDTYTIPDGITEIGSGAFYGCDSLTSITIPDSVTSIGDEAFGECVNVTLAVAEGSFAEQYAKENNFPFALTAE